MSGRACRAFACVCGILLSGCAAGPRYVPPQSAIPATYKEQVAPPLEPAVPADDVRRGDWWTVFGDDQLNALEDRLLHRSPTLADFEARLQEARAIVRAGRAGFFPVVTNTTALTRESGASGGRALPATGSAVRASTQYDLDNAATWEPDLWGRIRQTVAAGRASAQAAAGDLESTRLTVTADLASDYFELRSVDAQLALLDDTISAYQRAATLTRNQYDAGIVSRSDVEQADTQLAAAQAQAVDARLQRAQLEHAMAVLLGQLPSEVSVAAGPLKDDPPIIPLDVPSRLLQRRPDIAAAERRVAAANAQIGVASAAFFPALAVSAAGGFDATRLAEWLSWPMRFWSVGPSLATTLFDGGERRAVRAQAVAAYDETVAAYRETVLAAFQDVEDNIAAQRLLAEEAERQRVAVAAAQRSADIALNQYRAGTVDYLQVATQQTALLNNQRSAIGVAERRFVAAVQLVRALGGGWDGELKIN